MSLRPIVVLPTIRAARSREFYHAYLNSPAWRSRRNRAISLAGWRCERCTAKRDLQVHHRTYERLGAERDEDLEVLCADCHEGHHTESSAPGLGIHLTIAREALRADPLATIGELAEATKRLCAARHVPYTAAPIDRALELITGRRFIRREPRRLALAVPSPAIIRPAEAHEILMRIGATPRAMPVIETPHTVQRAHEANIRLELARLYREARRRKPLAMRLVEIFE